MQYIILITIFLSNFLLFAQDESQNEEEFIIGAFFSREYNEALFESFAKSDMNTIVCRADDETRKYISNYNVIANNADRKEDWIQHYATGFYSKWEAEENQKIKDAVGIKHKCGKQAIWKDKVCWSSQDYTTRSCSLMYGPHYKQEKRYKRWLYGCRDCIDYTVNYRMALDYDSKISRNTTVCKIKVVHRYAKVLGSKFDMIDEVLAQRTLKVSDFPSDGRFKNFELPSYRYNLKFTKSSVDKYTYKDRFGDNGIQYQVEWLGNNNLYTLYIDYVEVYDNEGKYFNSENSIRNTEAVRNIKSHVNKYSDWKNIKYWFANDEPSSLDAYTPMQFVDSLVRSEGGAPIITEFYPDWRILVNNDSQLVRYYNMVRPKKMMIDVYPFSPAKNPPISSKLESLRELFSIAHKLQPNFYYVAQGFGIRNQKRNWETWRLPNSTELNSTVMLALAHGVKGILFWNYDSYSSVSNIVEGLVDRNLKPTELWYLIKNNLVPRLKGRLGQTLLNLNYTGKYINIINPGKSVSSNNHNYLKIDEKGKAYHWHIGFFEKKNKPDNKYFLLTNLNISSNVAAQIEISNNTEYKNLSFRDVEGKVVNTKKTIGYSSSTTTYINVPPGEGYLFQLAPVVKYGGDLIYDEAIDERTTLEGNLFIKNNATLKINSDYYVKGKIVTENGKIEYGKNGVIHYLTKSNSINSADIEDKIDNDK